MRRRCSGTSARGRRSDVAGCAVKPFSSFFVVVGLAVALSACAGTDPMNPLGYQPESKENLLADLGFKMLLLNTPAKVAAFKKLPPHRISQTTFKGKQVWVIPTRMSAAVSMSAARRPTTPSSRRAGRR